MKLHEHQAREIMSRFGVPLPPGDVATTPGEAYAIAQALGGPVMIKAQVLAGGRGKGGGIKLVQTPLEAEAAAASLLGTILRDSTVRKVLVVPAVSIAQELYLGAMLDPTQKRIVFMASAAGGVDIEAVAREAPEQIVEVAADAVFGLTDYQARSFAFGLGLPSELVRGFATIARNLYRVFVECDATLAEINPLAITQDGALLALDTKIVLDDNALFRHMELALLRDPDEEDPFERRARGHGLSYVRLDGSIGCMVNGAGLAMATMDMLKLFGGKPANFLDVGGGADADRVAAALQIVLSDPNVDAVLLNIFGGITRCDEVARGIVSAMRETPAEVPIVARLSGTNEEEGARILAQANLLTAETLLEAAELAVRVTQATNEQQSSQEGEQ